MKVSNKKMTDEAIRAVAVHLVWEDNNLPEDLEVSADVKRLIEAFKEVVGSKQGTNSQFTEIFSNVAGMFGSVVGTAQSGIDNVKDRINKPSVLEQRIVDLEARVSKIEGESR